MQRLHYNVFTSYCTFSFPFLHAMPEVLYCFVCLVWLTHNGIVEIVTSREEELDIWLWDNLCFWLLENYWRLFTHIWWLLLGWWGGSFFFVLSTLEGTEDFLTFYFLSGFLMNVMWTLSFIQIYDSLQAWSLYFYNCCLIQQL